MLDSMHNMLKFSCKHESYPADFTKDPLRRALTFFCFQLMTSEVIDCQFSGKQKISALDMGGCSTLAEKLLYKLGD